jgi:nicotinamide mononucleotide (NMN) deamidase PncC
LAPLVRTVRPAAVRLFAPREVAIGMLLGLASGALVTWALAVTGVWT